MYSVIDMRVSGYRYIDSNFSIYLSKVIDIHTFIGNHWYFYPFVFVSEFNLTRYSSVFSPFLTKLLITTLSHAAYLITNSMLLQHLTMGTHPRICTHIAHFALLALALVAYFANAVRCLRVSATQQCSDGRILRDESKDESQRKQP